MRSFLAAMVVGSCVLGAPSVAAETVKPWCAPEVSELSDHVCYVDGGTPADGRHTLVIYLHGALATKPGFAWMQQRAMALHAKKHSFTVVIPTGPSDGVGYVWPASPKDLKEKEPAILAGIQKARADVEKRVGHSFDETFVVGFSSGAYYGSSLALRSALDVDGYIVLAGGGGWVAPAEGKRAPVFVGVSAADPLSANHSRGLAGTLGGLHWPYRAEERGVGHGVDWTFMAHGIAWLRERSPRAIAPTAAR
jgi:predicted esterase